MAELKQGTSGYATGDLDTWAGVTNDPNGDEIQAEHVNGLGAAIVQIQSILGLGTTLKGTVADLATRIQKQIQQDGIIHPVGSITMYGGPSAPTGWLFCDGTAVSRTTYADLWGVIGTTYGSGDGSTTFNLPDMRSRMPIGVGTGTGGGASGTGAPTGGSALNTISRGSWAGAEDAIVVTHNHGVTDPGHEHVARVNADAGGSASVIAGAAPDTDGLGQNTVSAGNITSNTTGVTINNEGSSGTDKNLPPYLGVQFMIKF